jgi:sensor domain CHASE-containing protein
MSLYYKTLLIITFTLIGLVTILHFVSQTILLNSFIELENKNVRQNVERGAAALFDHLSELNATAGDWAPWNETYTFVETPTETYIRANLMDSTFSNLGLNFMLFFNSSDQLVFGKAFDLINQTETDIPQSLQDHFAKNTSLLDYTDPESSMAGIILLPDQDPLLVASRPIVTNDYQGPSTEPSL